MKIAFTYAENSKIKGWWDEVTILVWGPSAKLISEKIDLQKIVNNLLEYKINMYTCKACADSYEES